MQSIPLPELDVAVASDLRSTTETTNRRIGLQALARWPADQLGLINPHEIRVVEGWHCLGEGGTWDCEALCRDLSAYLVHSDRTAMVRDGAARFNTIVFARGRHTL